MQDLSRLTAAALDSCTPRPAAQIKNAGQIRLVCTFGFIPYLIALPDEARRRDILMPSQWPSADSNESSVAIRRRPTDSTTTILFWGLGLTGVLGPLFVINHRLVVHRLRGQDAFSGPLSAASHSAGQWNGAPGAGLHLGFVHRATGFAWGATVKR